MSKNRRQRRAAKRVRPRTSAKPAITLDYIRRTTVADLQGALVYVERQDPELAKLTLEGLQSADPQRKLTAWYEIKQALATLDRLGAPGESTA